MGKGRREESKKEEKRKGEGRRAIEEGRKRGEERR